MNICRMLIKWRIQASVAVAIILLLMPLSKVIGLNAGPNLRDQNLALFDPHMSSFTCELEAKILPPIDAQAEAWFLQARELESPQIYFGNLDYRQIVRLTRQAAERHHWKALLNLASLYLEGHDVEKGPADALALVEAGMRLHLPAAYDRIGTYYDNGTGVDFDPSRAYAFWQKAALMGSPAAMGFLGKKLDAVTDSGNGTYWANPPIAKKMMSCAVGQGDGNAAFYLSMAYDIQSARAATKEEKQLALSAVQQGIRLGCEQCANKLAIQFSDPFSVEHMIVPFIDEDRAKRYSIIGDASGFDADYRFPNLDKVVPLPPADLPPWNGDRDTLLYAAMGVTPAPFFEVAPPVTAASRFDVPAPFGLHNTGTISAEHRAPFEGYWRPLGPDRKPLLDGSENPIRPGLYHQGEIFHRFTQPNRKPIENVNWQYWITTWGDREAVEPRAAKHLIRVVPRPAPFVSSPADVPCPRTGTWQPWVPADHPLAQLINQHWRQAWVVMGQPFPVPKKDWWLDLPNVTITWHLMDDAPVNINQAVKKPEPQQGGDHET